MYTNTCEFAKMSTTQNTSSSIITIAAWLLINFFTIIILATDFALNVKFFDVVPCGAFADTNNYLIAGLATTNNSISLLKNFNYKKTRQTKLIRNGFIQLY